MQTPVIIVNFKAYESAVGENAVNLAKVCDNVAKETNSSVAIAVQAADMYRVSQAVSIPVLAQHIDDNSFGSHTGNVIAESVKANGASGTLLNHSERRLRLDILEASIQRAKQIGLVTVACANDPKVGGAIKAFDPDFIAVEPPELIGGDISVSSAQPEIVKDAVHSVCGENVCKKVLVGAGVKTTEDVRKAVELGAAGVLVASGVTKAENPEQALKELISGFKQP
jgi:triosephosphate isomerase